MRTLSAALNIEQRKATRKPLIKLEVATYGHPAAVPTTELQFSSLAWEKLNSISDSTPVGPHALAVAGDGSVCRLRNESGTLKYQRVASPSGSSDWTANWVNFGGVVGGQAVAIAARDSEVIVVVGNGYNLYRRESNDYGANWGSWINMPSTRPCERGLAMAYKANGDIAVLYASDVNDPTSLYIDKRVSGTWSFNQIYGDFAISALAIYHDGDWNMLALLLDGSNIRLARGIYGDGDQYSTNTFSGWEYISSYKAKVDFSSQMALRQFQTGRAGRYTPTYYEQVSAVNEMRSSDTLAVDDPYITYHASLGAVYSFASDNNPWFYRLRPGTEFKDMDWYKAWTLDNIITNYGMALACDGTYLYATSPDQVWRAPLPGSWSPPAAGSGAGTNYSVTNAHVLGVRERVEALSPGNLTVSLDNSKGSYDVIGSGTGLNASLKRGSQVTLSIGYRTSSNLLSVAGKYYIERMRYSRRPGENLFIIYAIDAWALLEKYGFSRPVEWNSLTNEFTVYQLIEKVVQAVGGTLSYRSRSSYITSIYPHISVYAGENGAVVLRRLLLLVPDVIYFIGLDGYIVYPQSDDLASYKLRFPV